MCGRYYAMDRDKRWERTKLAYDAIVARHGRADDHGADRGRCSSRTKRASPTSSSKPIVVVDADGKPIGPVRDDDSIVFFNFRADRARQLTGRSRSTTSTASRGPTAGACTTPR